MTINELKNLLKKYNIEPTKARGQHFLLDESVVLKMVEAAKITSKDVVFEIGPGPGILTKSLLDTGARVKAIELDRRFIPLLNDRFSGEKLSVIQGNALQFFRDESLPTHFKVVTNLPYGITSEIITLLLSGEHAPQSITMMIQREVADRILAKPGKMSMLSVFVQTLAYVDRVVNVPKGAFFPAPKVDSAVVHIIPKTKDELKAFFQVFSQKDYFTLVERAFSAKRKKLKNTLGLEVNELKNKRPEELSVDNWRTLLISS